MGRESASALSRGSAIALASFLTVLFAGAGVAIQPRTTFGIVVFLLLAELYLRFPFLVPLVYITTWMIAYPVGHVGSFNLFLSDLVWLPGLVLVFTSRSLIPARRAMAHIRKQTAALLSFALISTILAVDIARSMVGMVQLIELLGLTFVTALSVRRVSDVKLILLGLFLTIGLNALLAVGQLVNLVPIPQLPMDNPLGEVGRVTGLSGNGLGGVLVVGLALASSFLLAPPWSRRALTAIAGTVMFLALVATGIRSAWLSLLVVYSVAGVLASLNTKRLGSNRIAAACLAGLSVSILAAVSLAIFPLASFYATRLMTLTSFNQPIAGSTTYSRLQFWEASYRMIESKPLFGVGLKNWVVVKQQFGLPDEILGVTTRAISDPHNYWFEIGAERGILGLLAMLAFYVTAAHITWNGFRGGWPKKIAFPLLLIVVSEPLAALFGGSVGGIRLWFVMLGLILAVQQLDDANNHSPELGRGDQTGQTLID